VRRRGPAGGVPGASRGIAGQSRARAGSHATASASADSSSSVPEGALLAAAEQILTEEGPSALTVRKVAQCAGIAPMGVYSRFEGKQGLLEALFVRGFEGLHRRVAQAGGGDARARLRDAALRYRRFAIGHPQHYALMFERMHEVQPGPTAMDRAHEAFEQLVRLVSDARATGPFGVGSDADVAQLPPTA
jgi:AcrR family transcriptional regulator